MFNKLNLYSTLMERLESFSTKLLLVRRLPATYRACLSEVLRRNTFTQHYTSQAHSVAEQMAAAREAEVRPTVPKGVWQGRLVRGWGKGVVQGDGGHAGEVRHRQGDREGGRWRVAQSVGVVRTAFTGGVRQTRSVAPRLGPPATGCAA